jgi:hypothetical protein
MNIKDITKLLGVEALDESVVTEVETKISDLINTKVDEKVEELSREKAEVLAKEMVEAALEEEKTSLKEELVQEYEEKFETYKDTLAEKFSLFVDDILAEKLQIPENIKEFARKGELYSDLIEQFKVRLGIDEGLVNEEAKSLLSEAKDEILKLRDEKNHLTEKFLNGKQLLHEASVTLYIYEKCEGLTESQKEKVFSILEGITDKEVIDKKFDIIVDTLTEEEVITEKMVTVKVVDPKKAVSELKKAGVSAKAVSESEVSFDAKDKKTAVEWLLKDGGWDRKELKKEYPDLVEAEGDGVATPLITEEKEEDNSFVSKYLNFI